MKKQLLIIFISVFLLSACATTETLNVWKEKGTDDLELSSVLVIGVAKDESYRRMFENLMVDEFAKLNVQASASFKIFPNVKKLDKAAVQGAIAQYNLDGVIVTRMIDRKKETVHHPSTTYVSSSYYRSYPYATSYNYSNSWYGYYDNSYQVTTSPAYSVDYEITTAETNVYDAKSEQLVWSAMTETSETGKPQAIRSFIDVMSKQLKSSKLF